MSNERIDSAMAEKILQGDDTDPDILQSLGLELIAELKRCYEELDSQHKMISELIEANTVKGEILDELRVCDECGEGWDYHPSGADCEAERQQASE